MFQPAMPVAKVLQGIHNSEYVLPAIQPEFVWKTEQIRSLFDGLMRGYPIGAFLFWKVEPAQAGQFTFYGFIHRLRRSAGVNRVPSCEVRYGGGFTTMTEGLIVSDPRILGGKPSVRGTRLSVEFLLELSASGATREQILAQYPQLTPEGLSAAFRYAAKALSGEHVWELRITS